MPTNSSAKHRLPNQAPLLSLYLVPHLRDSPIVAKVDWTAILFALLLCPCLKAQPTPTLSSGATLTAISTRTNTILHLLGARIPLKRDNTVSPSSQPNLKLVAELPGKALLLTDTYPSRPVGLSRCQAGEERFLRLITLSPYPKETFHVKLASCRDNIELAGDGLQWSPTVRTLTIHWLTTPASLTLHIASNGHLVR